MVESSFPPSRVGAAAIPDSVFITRQMMILSRCLTLTPPFLNRLSPEMFHPASPFSSTGWSSVGLLSLSGHTGGEAGCLSWTRVSQASATISRVMVLPADDDEATARSWMGRMASATLRRPIACSSVAAASRPSLVLGDSSELPMTTISRPGDMGQRRDRGRDRPQQRRPAPWHRGTQLLLLLALGYNHDGPE